jgi:REP element-mobilizing transposase RayT
MLEQPLVIAYHLIWTAYGWWLPNDPRGSGSSVIRSDLLAELGELHQGRKRVQPPGREVRAFYANAADLLRHAPLTFDEPARAVIAAAFAEVMAQQKYTCYACAIMPDHVHILVRKHKHLAEEMVDHLKETSRIRLIEAGQRSILHPTWTDGRGWKVFLEHPDEIRRTIRYIENNPLPLRLPKQAWPFVKPYDGWPLHPGHSPNSPYAKRLRVVGKYP